MRLQIRVTPKTAETPLKFELVNEDKAKLGDVSLADLVAMVQQFSSCFRYVEEK
jgi:hypothetical protein